jgi:dTMP kinase
VFVVFEGIDGSGKTTLSNRLAEDLRRAGKTVAHVREGGKFASTVTQAIRELGRDARNLAMTPFTELLLYAARDRQLLEEATLPALERSDVVIADRFLYTAEVLACHGRGLPYSEVRPVVEAAARGIKPDLVILVDVDPQVARARRRVSKIITPDPKPGSRKGLSGVGMQHRLQRGYRELAHKEPERWVVVDNTDANLDQLAAAVWELVMRALGEGAPSAIALAARSVRAHPPATATHAAARAAYLQWIDRRAVSEPHLAAYFLSGLCGDGFDERRLALASRAPAVIAHGLRGMNDACSWQLRRELSSAAPGEVARSLSAVIGDSEEGWSLRTELLALVPAAVVASLDGKDDARAWALRDAQYAREPIAVVESMKRLASKRAWDLREHWLAERKAKDDGHTSLLTYAHETAKVICASVSGLDDDRAWELRKEARPHAPIAALDSIGVLASERAWKWRDRHLHTATKVVMRTVAGVDDPRAWAMRHAVALSCKEALDSMIGLNGTEAWVIREMCQDVWPSTVVKSLGALGQSPRGRELVARQLARHPGNISLWKHAAALAAETSPLGRAAAG